MSRPPVNIKFRVIELFSKHLEERPLEENFVAPTEFSFDIVAESRANAKKKLIIIKVTVKVRELEKEFVHASITTTCVFEIENFDEVIVKKDEHIYSIPPDIDTLLKSVAISTTRGVMFSEFRGTYLFAAILPIIIIAPPVQQIEQQKNESVEV